MLERENQQNRQYQKRTLLMFKAPHGAKTLPVGAKRYLAA